MQAAFRRIATPKLYRQTVRHGGGGGHARPRSSAFFPQYVNYLNSEDQAMIAAVLGWGTLIFLVKWASSGPAKVIPPTPKYEGHIPSIEDPSWGDWVSENGGSNFEVYISNLDRA